MTTKYIHATFTGSVSMKVPVTPETLAWLEAQTPEGNRPFVSAEELAMRVLEEYNNASMVWDAMDVELESFDVVADKT